MTSLVVVGTNLLQMPGGSHQAPGRLQVSNQFVTTCLPRSVEVWRATVLGRVSRVWFGCIQSWQLQVTAHDFCGGVSAGVRGSIDLL